MTAVPGQETVDRASDDYALISRDEARSSSGRVGWQQDGVARRQDSAYKLLLEQLQAGRPRRDLVVAADAIRLTGQPDASILEVGCGSGYYSTVLEHLLEATIDYTGLDISPAMIGLTQRKRRGHRFQVGDATRLPYGDRAFDIVLIGVCLMHTPHYERAVEEATRVAKTWCIFHSVPMLRREKTQFLRKIAYGEPTTEIIFNERELRECIGCFGFVVRHKPGSIDYDLKKILGERTTTWTLVCERPSASVDPSMGNDKSIHPAAAVCSRPPQYARSTSSQQPGRSIGHLRRAAGARYWRCRDVIQRSPPARFYRHVSNPLWVARHCLASTLRQHRPLARGQLLDIGCGGQPYRRMFSAVDRYVGMNLPSPGGVVDVYGNAVQLPFGDHTFDTVLCNQVLEHVGEPHDLFAEAVRVLRPGGTLLLTTPQVWGLHHEPFDFCRYTVYGLVHLARAHGLDVPVATPTCGLWATVVQRVADTVVYNYARGTPTWLHGILELGLSPILLLGYYFDRLTGMRGDTLDNLLVARKRVMGMSWAWPIRPNASPAAPSSLRAA